MRNREHVALRPAVLALWLALLQIGWIGCGDERAATLDEIKTRSAWLDETVWAREMLAQQYEATLTALWDELVAANRRDNPAAKVQILSSIDFETLTVGSPRRVETLDHGIERFEMGAPHAALTPEMWTARLQELAGAGYRLVQSEWQHERFDPASDRSPARSQVAVVLHIANEKMQRRIILEGELAVEWSARRDARDHPIPAKIDATALRMLARDGPVPFQRILTYQRRERDRLSGIHPVLLYDLDKDGLAEIVLVRGSRVLWNEGGGQFREALLLDSPYGLTETMLTETGVIADLNGDAHPDLLTTRARGDLVLYLGDAAGRFAEEPKVTPRFESPLRAPSALTVGDIDADGDLDVWLAQYKPPYIGGQMPHPYYDANDGYPAYLLRNDGAGNFSPWTREAGLAEKRFRRTYTSSLVDLDDDDDLDLIVTSDFAGIDLYHNDGSGHFVDANATLKADRHLFGMSMAFADFDLDGRLDFFVAGMDSAVTRRLEAAGLGLEDRPDMQAMRMRMSFGNRMYLASDEGWREPAFRTEVARTGWTWGTTAFDFDNDGDPDIFAANGHESGQSTKDYCVIFWCHDIYEGNSEPNEALAIMVDERMRGVRSRRESWGGFQKNHLLMNRRGKSFVDVAFLLGLADEFDSLSAVSDDLDLDGRVDLVVVEDRGLRGEKLHVYRNQMETANHWIGFQLREQGSGISPVGASVVVRTPEQTFVDRVVTGDTVMGQHSTTLHFGLGASTRVESVAIRWRNGMQKVLRAPEIDQYHVIAAPGEDR
ncbi:MAG: CRTAC1 family protein [Myxococcales bacterium]|nr:CRTAC1 family protein [Myxococcales bacterium]